MAKKKAPRKIGDFALVSEDNLGERLDAATHIYHGGARCETDSRGHPTPGNRSPVELVVDASQGFIPLWDRNVTLRWRFQEQSLLPFLHSEALKDYVRTLFGEALLAWSPAVPVRFTEAQEPWDFEIVVRAEDNCNISGCTLARAFFPDAGQHELVLFPRLFDQSRQEQIETMAHEFGHIFGLRHFFAQVSESAFPSTIFGEHNKFTIMNYGEESQLTDTDRADLIRLYQEVWCGQRSEINGTPIRLMRPFSDGFMPAPSTLLLAQAPGVAAAGERTVRAETEPAYRPVMPA